jgi:hypothetical protein
MSIRAIFELAVLSGTAFSPGVSPRVVASWPAALADLESSGAHAALLARYGASGPAGVGPTAVANGS